jgi:cell division protease FtsH
MIDEAYKSAYEILNQNHDIMHRMAAALLERETLDADDIRKIIAGETLPPLKLGGGGGPTGLASDVQQVLRPESSRGTGFPEGSPSPA